MTKKIIVIALLFGFAFQVHAWYASNPASFRANHWELESTPIVPCKYARIWGSTCVDISGTSWYHNMMMQMAESLLANGFWVQFPQYQEWYDLVKWGY